MASSMECFFADRTFLMSMVEPVWYLGEAGSPSGLGIYSAVMLYSEKAPGT